MPLGLSVNVELFSNNNPAVLVALLVRAVVIYRKHAERLLSGAIARPTADRLVSSEHGMR